MATKTYTLKKRSNLVVGYGSRTLTHRNATFDRLASQTEKTKNIEFVDGVYATAVEAEQTFLEGAQFADEIAST